MTVFTCFVVAEKEIRKGRVEFSTLPFSVCKTFAGIYTTDGASKEIPKKIALLHIQASLLVRKLPLKEHIPLL